jgi:hypothetical protein
MTWHHRGRVKVKASGKDYTQHNTTHIGDSNLNHHHQGMPYIRLIKAFDGCVCVDICDVLFVTLPFLVESTTTAPTHTHTPPRHNPISICIYVCI